MLQNTANINCETAIENCQKCHAVCVETVKNCLEYGGHHAADGIIKTLQDCVQICITSADFMSRNSVFHQKLCEICAIICERCAVNCESLAEGDDFMAECGKACRKCEESCLEMSNTPEMLHG